MFWNVVLNISLLTVSGAISTKNRGSGILVWWCLIFIIYLTVKPICASISAHIIQRRLVVEWMFLNTILNDLSVWNWNVWYSASWLFKKCKDMKIFCDYWKSLFEF